MYQVYHNTRCENCNADLTQPGSVSVSFSCANQVFDRDSQVDQQGELEDVEDLISNGYHSGSLCNACGDILEELPTG